jgi:hypothetical protein
MLPSIVSTSVARPGATDQAPNRSAARNDSPSKDSLSKGTSFDQVFSSTVSGSDAQPDPAPAEKAQNAGQPNSTGEPVTKESGSGQSAAKQPNAQLIDISATAIPASAASAPVAVQPAAGQPRAARAEPTEPLRRPRHMPPAAGVSVRPAGAPLDPSSLILLLGAGAAPAIASTPEPGATPKAAETVGDKETQTIAGLAPAVRQNAVTPDAGLAFALRLSRTAAAPTESDSSSGPTGGASLSSFANDLEAAAAKAVAEVKLHPVEENGGGVGPVLAGAGVAAAPTPGNRPAEPEPAANVAAAPAADLTSPASAPVRAVRLQLAAEGSQRVDLTLVERAGALSVSVRSADSNLARSLQEHLPDLSARLGEQHYQTETWTTRLEPPSMELPSASAGSAGSGESGNRNFESGGQKHGGQNGNSNPGQQQGGRERETPAWFEELAAFGRTPHIRSEYLWVQ